MTVEKVLKILEDEVAPVKLSDEFCAKYKMYDNSGIIINCGEQVSGVLFTLDLSLASVQKAISLGYNLIVTHHPAVYGGINRFDLTCNPQAQALAECMKGGISVISMHLNFDAAQKGIDFSLMLGLGGGNCPEKVHLPAQGGGYGRCYNVAEKNFAQFVEEIKTTFMTDRAVAYGSPERKIKRVASFCGSGCDEGSIAFAKENDADVFVSSDLKHHNITELVESGLCVVQLTHYCAEAFGLNKIYNIIEQILQTPSSFFFDERFM